eukprot:10445696-Ditylum_brightwellii.AAC.1
MSLYFNKSRATLTIWSLKKGKTIYFFNKEENNNEEIHIMDSEDEIFDLTTQEKLSPLSEKDMLDSPLELENDDDEMNEGNEFWNIALTLEEKEGTWSVPLGRKFKKKLVSNLYTMYHKTEHHKICSLLDNNFNVTEIYTCLDSCSVKHRL